MFVRLKQVANNLYHLAKKATVEWLKCLEREKRLVNKSIGEYGLVAQTLRAKKRKGLQSYTHIISNSP